MIKGLTGIPENEQSLVFAGKPMIKETDTLKDYNIQNLSTIFVLLRLKGGL
jgi:hypothetical protein